MPANSPVRARSRSSGKLTPLLASVVLATAFSHSATADIYKYVDKYGRVTLTDTPDKTGGMKLVKTWKGWVSRPLNTHGPRFVRSREEYNDLIAEAAAKNKLPAELVHAVITAESAYQPDAISRAGAVGLMQLMPETGRRYGVSNRYDPVQNVHGGTRYLRDLMDMFSNNVVLAVAGYNAGENAVIQYGRKIPPYAETQEYVRRVVQYFKQYADEGIGRKTGASAATPVRASVLTPIAPAPANTAVTAATTRTRTVGSEDGTAVSALAREEPAPRKPVVNNTQVWPRPKKRIAIIKWADEDS
ncbi:MAG: lytic transglycosylase domain-containing protein [Gammaproteobacteria bacterium]|nr:lytic transglycosylase domain-containing protein [Gammaproteobacteria bacterium]MCG3143808.1 Membrane-bound lytic murein transglycosylase F [Gammaproteobacteria bacterium]